MTTETETTTAVATPVKANKAKKAKGKKPAKKVAKKTSGTAPAEYGAVKAHDVPWNEKKVTVFKALKGLRATSRQTAVGSAAIAEKGGSITERDARHYCYHAHAAGLVDFVEVEGTRGYQFYLTVKGQKLDPSAEFKAQQAAKNN